MSGNTFTKYTKYTTKELESYLADPGTCVQKLEWIDLISVLPKYLGNICEGVKACLTQKIGTYDRKVDGVILAFKNTQILSPLSAIRPNSVRVHVKLRTDFYVFRPQIGATIEGTVQYVSSNYLSAVIYRVFNVTIKLKMQKITNFARGTVISFIVKAFDMKSDLPFIEGQLISKSDDDNPVTNGVKKEKPPKNVSQVKPEQNDFDANKVGVCGESIEAKIEDNKPDDFVSSKKDTNMKGSKRKHTKPNGHAAKDDKQSDEEMQLSINALLSGLEKEMSDAIESDPSTSGIEQPKKETQSAEKSRPLKKKKKKKHDIDSLEAELLQKFAAQCNEPEQHDLQTDTSGQTKNDQIDTSKTEKVKKTKNKKNKAPKLEEDDFEASIMSSILKCVAEADEPQRNDSTPLKKAGKIARKSVRFDSTITEASFNAFDSSELLEISQLQSPALSSTLKGNEQK
ncbi:uncharacterized protein Polr1F [Ochlerotatus camptorhynchus]|uniref:uncharacterized protein Polr1F n=1 Tax=Ochlerotatus camptorhynchus TaxID=644619 RepID=UPI0031D4C588